MQGAVCRDDRVEMISNWESSPLTDDSTEIVQLDVTVSCVNFVDKVVHDLKGSFASPQESAVQDGR